jgi:hypothetical protein
MAFIDNSRKRVEKNTRKKDAADNNFDNSFLEKQTNLNNREQELRKKQELIENSKMSLELQKKELSKKENDINNFNKSLMVTKDSLVKKEQKLQKEQNLFEGLKESLERQKDVLNNKETGLKSKENELLNRKSDLNKKEADIQNRESKLQPKESSLKNREERIKTDEIRIQEDLFSVEKSQKILASRESKSNENSERFETVLEKEKNSLNKINEIIDQWNDEFKNLKKLSTSEDNVNDVIKDKITENQKVIQELKSLYIVALKDMKDTYNAMVDNNQVIAADKKFSELELANYNLNSELNTLQIEYAKFKSSKEWEDSQERSDLKQNISNLEYDRNELNNQVDLLNVNLSELNIQDSYTESLKALFNDKKPQVIFDDLSKKDKEIERLNDEISMLPDLNTLNRLEAANDEISNLSDRLKQYGNIDNKLMLINNIENEKLNNESLLIHNTNLENINSALNKEIERLDPTIKDSRSETEVIASFANYDEYKGIGFVDKKSSTDELVWLNNVIKGIKDEGFVFPERLIYAFHTSLKTGDMNPITILAGASGTGKSELPRLYAYYGGLNCINIPVQPNWDSLESLLGYYSSIDDKFAATELFKYLISINNNTNEMDGKVNIVLLDEMNLAHTELYFAEFLSKLEEKRDKDVSINVKLTSSVDYNLGITSNMHWVGTMNQDETTKSLSPKVIDRGIIITYPKPKKLIDKELHKDKDPHSKFITTDIWESWISGSSNNETYKDEINKYRTLSEEIIAIESNMNLSISFRIWQSISNYIANYPLVLSSLNKIEEYESSEKSENESNEKLNDEKHESLLNELKEQMKVAFEDQLVQKIIPTLNGIETDGFSGDILLKIKRKFDDVLKDSVWSDDFDKAMNLGNGQFRWCSSDYIYSVEKHKLEKEKLEKEKLEKEKLEKEKLEKEKLEKERLEKERLEKQKLEKERLEKQKLEKERLEKERLENSNTKISMSNKKQSKNNKNKKK